MNIFATDNDPRICAINLDDKRVNKMILESAQMLCTALHKSGANHLAQYKQTHPNHPVNIWVRQTRFNYVWLLLHFKALCNEYTMRKGKIHKTSSLYPDLLAGACFIPSGPLTPFANCAANASKGISYKHIADTNLAYRLYLIDRWATDTIIPKWTNRFRPF